MSAAPRKPQDPAVIQAGLLSLLKALNGLPADSLAGAAYISALRRRGEDLAALGGVEALARGSSRSPRRLVGPRRCDQRGLVDHPGMDCMSRRLPALPMCRRGG